MVNIKSIFKCTLLQNRKEFAHEFWSKDLHAWLLSKKILKEFILWPVSYESASLSSSSQIQEVVTHDSFYWVNKWEMVSHCFISISLIILKLKKSSFANCAFLFSRIVCPYTFLKNLSYSFSFSFPGVLHILELLNILLILVINIFLVYHLFIQKLSIYVVWQAYFMVLCLA